MRVLVACANGSGTSLMMSLTVKKAFNKLGLTPTSVHHCAIAEGKSSATMYDVIFTSSAFIDQFNHAKEKGIPVIGMLNVMSEQEALDKIKEANLLEKFKK